MKRSIDGNSRHQDLTAHIHSLLAVRLEDEQWTQSGRIPILFGTHEPSGKRVAVKVQIASHQAKREVEVMKRLRDVAQPHAAPFIIGFVADATAAGWHFIAMEALGTSEKPAVEWMTLMLGPEPEPGAPKPPRPEPVPLETTAQLFADSLVGLSYMHAAGVVHLDIKSQNIMVAPRTGDSTDGNGGYYGGPPPRYAVRLIDFGQSRVTMQPITGVRGSLSYMAPEMLVPSLVGISGASYNGISGAIAYDGAKADVWALGVVLFSSTFHFFPVDSAAPGDKTFVRIRAAQDTGRSTCRTALAFYGRSADEFPPTLLALIDRLLIVHAPSRPTLHEACGAALPWLEGACPRSAQLVRAVIEVAANDDLKAANAIARVVAEVA